MDPDLALHALGLNRMDPLPIQFEVKSGRDGVEVGWVPDLDCFGHLLGPILDPFQTPIWGY